MMKFCFIESAFPPPFVGGKERQLYLVVKYALSLGVDCEVLTKKPQRTNDCDNELRCVRRYSGNLGILLRTIRLCLTSHSVCFYINTPSRLGQLVTLISSSLGKRIIFKVSSKKVVSFICGESFLGRYVRKNVDIFHVLSEEDLKELCCSGVSESRILLNYNGVEIPKVRITEYKVGVDVSLVYAGRIDENKNLLSIIRAVNTLNKNDAGFKYNLKVCGDGSCLSDAIKYVEEFGLSEQIKFFGFLSPLDTHQKLLESDYLVSPSFSEGMSNVLLEAASIGLPIICSRVGAYKEILGEFQDFLTFDPHLPNSLEGALLKAGGLEARQRREYGDYLRSRTVAVFSIDSVADNLVKTLSVVA